MSRTLHQAILRSAEAALPLQQADGSMPPGNNGPWKHEETPVRTTAHWAITFHRSYHLSGQEQFRDAALRCCDYLVSKQARPHNYTFYCRLPGKAANLCNGLIGQAWAVEALLTIGGDVPDKPYLEIADEVLSMHPYNESKHGWQAVEITGRSLPFHLTLNQQLWFAVMSYWAGETSQPLRQKALDFFSHLGSNLIYLEPGLLSHNFPIPAIQRKMREFYNVFTCFLKFGRPKNKSSILRERSIGYLPFILQGFTKFENKFPGQLFKVFDGKDIILGIADFILRQGPNSYGAGNKYAWSYNPVGIEMAFFLQVFGKQLHGNRNDQPEDWLKEQMGNHFDWKAGMMRMRTGDPTVLAARIYEAVHLANYTLSSFEE